MSKPQAHGGRTFAPMKSKDLEQGKDGYWAVCFRNLLNLTDNEIRLHFCQFGDVGPVRNAGAWTFVRFFTEADARRCLENDHSSSYLGDTIKPARNTNTGANNVPDYKIGNPSEEVDLLPGADLAQPPPSIAPQQATQVFPIPADQGPGNNNNTSPDKRPVFYPGRPNYDNKNFHGRPGSNHFVSRGGNPRHQASCPPFNQPQPPHMTPYEGNLRGRSRGKFRQPRQAVPLHFSPPPPAAQASCEGLMEEDMRKRLEMIAMGVSLPELHVPVTSVPERHVPGVSQVRTSPLKNTILADMEKMAMMKEQSKEAHAKLNGAAPELIAKIHSNIIVSNLPADFTAQELHQLLTREGVIDIDIKVTPDHIRYCHVQVETQEAEQQLLDLDKQLYRGLPIFAMKIEDTIVTALKSLGVK